MSLISLIASLSTTSGSAATAATEYVVDVLNADCEFSPRDGATLFSLNGYLELWGGYTPTLVGDRWRSKTGINWTQGEDSGIPASHTIGHVTLDGGVLIFGSDGYAQNSANRTKMWFFDNVNGLELLTSNWGIGSFILFGFCKHIVDRKEWVYFGLGQVSFEPLDGFNNKIFRTDGTTVEVVNASLPVGMRNRSTPIFWSIGGKLRIGLGGVYPAQGIFYDDIWVSSDDGVTWTQEVTGLTDFRCIYGNGAVYDGKLWYLMGYDTINEKGLYWCDPTKGVDNWTLQPGYLNIAERHASALTLHNNKLYIVSGNLHNDSYQIRKVI